MCMFYTSIKLKMSILLFELCSGTIYLVKWITQAQETNLFNSF